MSDLDCRGFILSVVSDPRLPTQSNRTKLDIGFRNIFEQKSLQKYGPTKCFIWIALDSIFKRKLKFIWRVLVRKFYFFLRTLLDTDIRTIVRILTMREGYMFYSRHKKSDSIHQTRAIRPNFTRQKKLLVRTIKKCKFSYK